MNGFLLGKKYPAFYKYEGSLPCSKQPATALYPVPDAFNPCTPILFF